MGRVSPWSETRFYGLLPSFRPLGWELLSIDVTEWRTSPGDSATSIDEEIAYL